MSTTTDLSGRVAIVTGAASGIGRASARLLAEAGADVVCADISGDGAQATATQLGPHASAAALNVADRDAVDALVTSTAERFGRLDVMANIAGIISTGPSTDVDPAELERILGVNLKGVIWGIQAAARVMARQGAGSIINMASGAVDVAAPQLLSYAVSKAGVVQATKTFAIELGPMGVRVNAVAPGFVETGMTGRHFTNPDGSIDPVKREATFAPMRQASPLGMVGEPEDIGHAVLYLASDASRFMTGQVLRPNGGVGMPG
jgi:3-oxoacyl-[acyl-carrier protein] reductase